MAKPKITKPNQRISKAPVNSKWFTNVAKSMGITAHDLIKDLTPNTTDFLQYNASDTMDLVRDLRTNVGARANVNRQLSNIPQVAVGKDALKNVLDDIKSGKLNNTERAQEFDEDMDFGFGGLFDEDDGIQFGEDESGGTDVTVNQYKTNNMLDSLPLAKAMANNTEVTVNAIATVAEQNMAIESEKLMFSHKSVNSVLGGLTAINDNLSTLVKFHGDSTSKFYASSIKYYEESLEQLKNMQAAKTASENSNAADNAANSLGDSLYTYTGGVKLNAYAKVIKENLSAIKEENATLASMSDMLTDTETLKGLAKNPIGTMMRIGMKSMVPVATKASLQAIDASMSAIIPAFMAKINTMEDHDNPIMAYLYKAFGSKAKLSYKVDLGEYEKGPVSWDGQDKKTLNEVIPAYLRRMEAALSGQHERVFDYKSGTFTNSRDLKKSYDDRLGDVESTGFVEARTKMRDIAQAMNANADAMKQFEADMREYFSAITKKGAMINPFITKDSDGFDVDELTESGLFDSDDRRINLMRRTLKGLSAKDLTNMATTGIYDSRKATNSYMDEIRKNPSASGHATLFNGGMYGSDGKLTYDPTKSGRTDTFGSTQLDYLRDIRSILATGIAVYNPSRNPHSRSLRRFGAEATRAAINTGDDSITSSYVRPDQLNLDQLMSISDADMAEVYKSTEAKAGKDNKVSKMFGSKMGRANQYVNTATSMIDNRIFRVLFGSNEENRAEFEYNKNAMKNMFGEDKEKPGIGMLGSTIGFFGDTVKGVGAYFTGQPYTKHDGTRVDASADSILGKMKTFFSGSVDKLVGAKGDDKDLGLMGKISKDFIDGYDSFKTTLFGDKKFGDETKKETLKELTGKVKDRLPKSIGAGLAGATVKTALASKMGILGSVLLPGGPIGAAITGTAIGFLSQSETFKNWAFGEKNGEGQRMGGFVPKSLVEMIEKNGGTVKKGAIIGGAVGILPSFFLPGGPITGAVLGVGTGLLSKSDAFQEMLYGKDFNKKDKKSIMDGAFGKIYKSTIGKATKDANPKLSAFLGGTGMAAGVAQGVGLLPSFLLPGGPITGAMLGLAGGIMASSDKFQQFLFGDKDIDGKRYGGLMTKFTNWFDTTVVSPFKIKANEINDNIYEFVRGKIVNPFLHAFDPLTQAFKFVVDDAKDAMKSTWSRITDGVIGSFNDNVIKPFGESLEKYVVDPLKKTFNTMLKVIGKGLGALVASPFKLLAKVGDMADVFNTRKVMKNEKKNRRSEFKEMISSKKADGTLGIKDIMGGVRRQFIFGKEKDELLNRALPYRQDRADKKQEREDSLKATMEERRAKTADMRKQYEEDRDFGKGNNWKYASKKQKAEREEELKKKSVWYQEQIAVKTDETVKKLSTIEDVIKDVPSYEKDKLNVLKQIKDSLHSTLDNLSDLKKNSAKDMLNNLGSTLKNKGQSHADGLDKVPENGYIAELHEGEMVVPKKGAGLLRGIFGAGKGDEKNSIVSSITNKLIGGKDGENGGILGGMLGKLGRKDKSDRADNSLGLSRDEQMQMKEMLDMERYDQASRKNVDYIQGQMSAKKKEKEDAKFKVDLLSAINRGTEETKKGNSFWDNLFGNNGLLGKFFGGIGGFAKKLLSMVGGIGGALSLGGAFMAGNFINEKEKVSKETGYSLGETLYGAGDEGQLNAEGLYARDNTMDSIVRNGVRATPKVYNKVVKPTARGVKQGYGAAKAGATNAYQSFDNLANPKHVAAGKDFLGESYNYTTTLERKGLQKPAGLISDFGKATKKKAGDTMAMLLDLTKKALTSLEGMVAKKFPSVKGLSSAASGMFKTMTKDADTIVSRYGTKITMFFADGAADFIPIIGQVTEAAMTVWDVGTGLTAGNAGNLFQVGKDEVDFNMRMITSILQGACKFSWFSVIWMINEICSSMYDFSFLTQLARKIYEMVPQNSAKKLDMSSDLKGVNVDSATMDDVLMAATGGNAEAVAALKDKDFSKLKSNDLKKYGISAVELQEIKRKQYNEKNGTHMDKQGFADETSKTVGQKILGSKTVKNIKGTFSKSSARGHLGLNKDAEMSSKERRGFALAKTGINVRNSIAKLFGKEEIDDAEWFQKKRYDENGKLSLNGKGTLSYAEARENSEQSKVDKANAKINKRLENEPKSGVGKWWNNMMIGVQKGKREKARKRIGTSEEDKKKKKSTKGSKGSKTFTPQYENKNAANQTEKDIDAQMYEMYGTKAAGKGEDSDVKATAKKKAANPAKKPVKTQTDIAKPVDKAANNAVKTTESLFGKLTKSVNSVAQKLTKGLSTGEKTLTSAFTKLQKALVSSGKVTSDRMHKATREGEKDLEKMSKNLIRDAKSLFSTLKDKVDKSLKGIKNIKISGATTVSPTFTVDDPKKFLTDLFGDIGKKIEETKKPKKKSHNAGSSGISANLSQKTNNESGKFIAPSNSTTTNNSTSNNNKFVFYSQNDDQWSNKKLVGDKTLAQAGCGPTSIAMAVSQTTGEEITPDVIAALGKRDLPGYSTYNLFPEIAKKFAMNYEDTESEADIVRYLRDGIPVMLSGEATGGGEASPYTSDGHVVVANNIKGDDVFVSDPRGKNYSRSYKLSQLLTGMNKAMVMRPTSQTKDKLGMSKGSLKGIDGQFDGTLNTDLEGMKLSPELLKQNLGSSGQIKQFEKVLAYAKAFEKKLTYSQPAREGINNNKLSADCSSFTRHVFNRAAGMDIGSNTTAQDKTGQSVGMNEAQPSDLVLFNGHVGIVWDSNKNMIDIGSGTGPVIRSYDTSYWKGRHPRIRRVLTEPNKMVDNTIPNANSALGITSVDGLNLGNVNGASGSSGGETQAETPELFGAFSSMNKIGQNMVASVFNGKQVDLFGNSGGSTTNTTSTNMINGKTVKALFTSYYPEDSALQGGFLDAQGNKLDPSKKTCAAPKEIPFGTKIQVQGTGTEKDGQIYTVNDRGGAIKVRGDEYQFDLLSPDHKTAYSWGRKNGSAVVGTPDGSAGKDPGGDAGSSGIPNSMNGWAYYKQGDPRWNTEGIGGSTVERAGCGPTSQAMMLTTMFGQSIRPDVMTKYGLKNGTWSSNGMSWSMPDKVAQDFKLSKSGEWSGKSDASLQGIKNAIKAGNPVIMSGQGTSNSLSSPFTSGGHIVLGVGVDGSNNIIINDPRDPKYTKSYTDEDMRRGAAGLRHAWSFAKTGSSAIPSTIQTDGSFTPGSSATTSGGGSEAPTPELFGAFSSMNKIGQNMVASVFNGKQVDLFASDSSGGTTTGGSVDISNIGETKPAVWKFFTGMGYTPEATAGIMGNLQQESTINPTLIQGNGKGPAAGIAQWENYNSKSARWKQMANHAEGKGKDWKDLQSQLEFIDMELAGNGPVDKYTSQLLSRKYGGYNALKSSTDIGKATESFEGSFERAGVKVMEKRKKYAKDIYNQMSGSAGKGDGKGDGKTHIIQPAVDKKAKPLTKVNTLFSDRVEKAGKGDGLSKLKRAQQDVLRTVGSSYKFNNGNNSNSNNGSQQAITSACVEMMTQVVEELAAIRNNTGITAENTKDIKIASANEPVVNQTPGQFNNNTSKRVGSNSNSGYGLARDIASF